MNKINESIITIFNNLKDHISILLDNGKILLISKNIKELLGYTEDEIIGKEIKELFYDDKEYPNFVEFLKNKDRESLSIKLKTKKGNYKFFKIIIVELEEQKNLLILKDITDEKRKDILTKILYKISFFGFRTTNLKEFFEEIHKLIKEYLYAENFYISLIDESGEYIYFPYFVDLKDEKPEPRKRRGGITEYILKNEKPFLLKREEIEKLRDKGEIIFYGTCPEFYIGAPLKVFDKFIGVIALQIYEKEVYYTDEDLNLISFIADNISVVIQRLKENENRRALLNNIKGFIFTATLESNNLKVIEIEGNFENITGFNKNEFINKNINLENYIYKDDFEKIQNLISNVNKNENQAYTEIFRFINKNGEIKWASINISILRAEIPRVKIIQGIVTDITESVKTKEELFETEKKFKVLFENSPVGITLTDKNGEIIYCNPKWEEIMGYKLHELKNIKWMDLTYPEDLQEDLEKFNKLVKGELYSYSLEKRGIRKNGEIFWMNLKVVRVDDEKGNFLYEIAMTEDITIRKEMEIKLKESEKRFRTLFEKSPIGITMSDRDGKLLASNDAFLKMVGYSLDELSKISWKEYTYPDDIDKDWENFQKLINKEIDFYTIEKRFVRKDGEIIFARLNCAALFDEKGEFQFEFAMIEDITESKILENALYESEKKFRLFFEKNPLGVAIVDENDNYIAYNNVYLNLLGYSEEELKKLTWKDITFPEDYKRQYELFKKLINKEIDYFNIEKRYIRKDGNIFWGQLFASAVYDENGKFLYSFGILRDITEEKRLKEELEESRKKLAKSLDNVLNLVTKITEMKDPYTLGHQGRVAYLAEKIAKKLNLPEDVVEKIRLASFMHDIGKLTIPTEVLNKGGKLSENEFSLVKEHSHNGYEIIKRVEYLSPIADIVLQHHERFDGSGYPLGLKDDDILLEARIIAVCDVYEAMTSHRPYRPAFSCEEALKELKEKKGILYDPIIVDIFEELIINKEINSE
ncbi:MAG: PAS domain S-box protein [Caldisericia bacterium]|nr:PAS domain S-box protein [Caldisericia bacterium]